MKSKHFYDYRVAAGIISIIVCFAVYAFLLSMFKYLVIGYINKTIPIVLFVVTIVFYLFFIVCGVWFVKLICVKMLSYLTVNSSKITWRCIFSCTVCIKADECAYVGIADFAEHNRGLPIIRGDEISYIYLSTEPLPEKYRHKIDTAKCKKGFIKFAYSDKLCQELISILPKDKTNYLISFYNRMQAADRANKLKQQNKKKRKSKKK